MTSKFQDMVKKHLMLEAQPPKILIHSTITKWLLCHIYQIDVSCYPYTLYLVV